MSPSDVTPLIKEVSMHLYVKQCRHAIKTYVGILFSTSLYKIQTLSDLIYVVEKIHRTTDAFLVYIYYTFE